MNPIWTQRGATVTDEAAGDGVATVLGGNPLAIEPIGPIESCTIVYSGTLADELFAPHPGNWMGTGVDALAALCDRLRRRIAADGSVLLRPHARHILSDVPSCQRFLKEQAGETLGLVLEPAAMFEAPMLDAADEHLERMFEAIGPHAGAVWLSDVRAEGDELSAAPLAEGALPWGIIASLLERHVSAEVPVILGEADVVVWSGLRQGV